MSLCLGANPLRLDSTTRANAREGDDVKKTLNHPNANQAAKKRVLTLRKETLRRLVTAGGDTRPPIETSGGRPCTSERPPG
jgi:hypothetical protein